MKKILYISIFLSVLLAGTNSAVAQDKFSEVRYGAQFGYEWISNAYNHNGYSMNLNFDYKFHRTFYGSCIIHAGSCQWHTDKEIIVSGNSENKKFRHNVNEIIIGIGPGADLISNKEDRVFVCLYAGASSLMKKNDIFNDDKGEIEARETHNAGFGSLVHLGYEHCFHNIATLGGSLEGIYSCGQFNWGINIRFGFSF